MRRASHIFKRIDIGLTACQSKAIYQLMARCLLRPTRQEGPEIWLPWRDRQSLEVKWGRSHVVQSLEGVGGEWQQGLGELKSWGTENQQRLTLRALQHEEKHLNLCCVWCCPLNAVSGACVYDLQKRLDPTGDGRSLWAGADCWDCSTNQQGDVVLVRFRSSAWAANIWSCRRVNTASPLRYKWCPVNCWNPRASSVWPRIDGQWTHAGRGKRNIKLVTSLVGGDREECRESSVNAVAWVGTCSATVSFTPPAGIRQTRGPHWCGFLLRNQHCDL